MLIILDIKNKPKECNKCPFGARGCEVKLLHNCPLQNAPKVVELNSWSAICNADRIFGITQEEE